MRRTFQKLLMLSFFLFLIPVYAGVDMTIGNGMLVTTTGGTEIQVSGNLIENGTGYLKGTVTSGNRSSVTKFAGLSLSSALNGIITRVTGTQYSGTGTNFTRYYEVNNQSTSTDLTANDTVVTTTGEAGSLIGPFFLYTKNGSNWKGYGFGSTGTTVTANNVTYTHNSQTDLVISEGVGVKVKIFLQGPYNTTNHNMNSTLNSIIPHTSPYTEDARTVSAVPSTAVDWVLVQLRDKTTPATIIASRSAFLKSDGNLIDDNATSGRGIGIAAPPGDYYIVIKHRNHLAVMTASAQTGLTWGTATSVSTYDFTTASSKFYGGSAGTIQVESNVWAMISGDGNGNGQVQNNDSESIWKPDNGTSGYKNSDFNLNGQVQNNDNETYWKPNNGKGTQVP
jgi:trimeric autotransporter adhesin